MSLLSWGRYPKVKNTVFKFEKVETLKPIIEEHYLQVIHEVLYG